MNIKTVHNVYFIGVGGIGMSAIARYFAAHKKNVAGYDKTETKLTKALIKDGIAIHFEDDVSIIPEKFKNIANTLVVFTPAVPRENNELQYFIKEGYTLLKRAEVLGLITKESCCLAVSGTHGKTTTSAILGHIMQSVNATAFLGGIAENYNSNLILGNEEITVMEADEFDRSFLHLSPNIACVTSMDADHLDIYGEHEELKKSFQEFTDKVTDTLIVAKGLPLNGLTYAIDEDADYKAFNVRIDNGRYLFDVDTPIGICKDISFLLPGKHNIMNALAALAMATEYGLSLPEIKKAIKSFMGVQRRFSYKINQEDLVLIDDYAHHPTEINAVADSIFERYAKEDVLVVFQPHLFSRTRDFSEDFVTSLSRFKELLLLPIYPARELPIKGVTSDWLLRQISSEKKKMTSKETLISDVKKSKAKIIVMLGAGDIGIMVNEVKQNLLNK